MMLKAHKIYLLLSLAGIVMGIWLFFSPGTLFIVFLTIALLCVFNLYLRELPERKIIMAICVIAIGTRFLFAIFNYYFSYYKGIGADFVGDARAYSGSGQYIAEVITNKPMPDVDGNEPDWWKWLRDNYKGTIPDMGYRVDPFAKYIGLIYAAFGYDPIAVKLINSLLSICTGILMFYLIKDMFSVETAKIGLTLIVFWPSTLLWSITGTKDALSCFLVVLTIFIFINLRKNLDILNMFLVVTMLIIKNFNIVLILFCAIFLISLFKRNVFKVPTYMHIFTLLISVLLLKISTNLIISFRVYLFYCLFAAFVISTLFLFLNRKTLVILPVIMGLILFLSYRINANRYFQNFVQQAITTQVSQVVAADSAYRIYPNRFYLQISNSAQYISPITISELLLSYLKGIGYAFFAPFPWVKETGKGLMAYFQMVIYYFLSPFIIIGALIALRYRLKESMPVILFILIMGSIFALHEGNVGTVFRHRDVLMVFLLAFSAIGINKVFVQRFLTI